MVLLSVIAEKMPTEQAQIQETLKFNLPVSVCAVRALKPFISYSDEKGTHMPRLLKITLYSLAALFALLLALIGYVAATFNPNDYKGLIISTVQEKKQRTMTIPGEIKLQFFPKIGANLGKITLSEHKSMDEFAAIDSARVSLEFMPLLKKELVVDKVQIEGIRANLIRHPDGRLNIDDLLSKDEKSQDKLRFDIDGVLLDKAHIKFDDRQGKRKLELSEMRLETGKIANGVASKLKLDTRITGNVPQMAVQLHLDTGFTLDLDAQQYALQKLDFLLKGQIAGFSRLESRAQGDLKLNLAKGELAVKGLQASAQGHSDGQDLKAELSVPELNLDEKNMQADKIKLSAGMAKGNDKVEVEMNAPSFKGSRQQVQLPQVVMHVNLSQGGAQAKGKLETGLQMDLDKMQVRAASMRLQMEGKSGEHVINANLSSPLAVDLKNSSLSLPQLAAQMKLPHPNPQLGTMAISFDGNANLDWKKQQANAQIKGRLDESSFDAKLGLANFAAPRYRANLVLDKIDADRYRSAPSAAPAQAAGNKNAEVAVNLQALAKLYAEGSLQVGNIKFAGMQMNNLKLDLHAQPGKVDIAPLSAAMYGGTMQGSISLLLGREQQFIVKQNLSGIAIGPLLKDAIKKNPLDGRGNVQVDISSTGRTLSQLKRSLNGNAKLNLQDGSISGFNLAQILRNAKDPASGGSKTGTANANDKTDFSEMSASFKIAQGIARNDDLSVKSPLFRVAGSGDVNLGEDKLDYLAKPTIVATLQGQGGPELQALKGLTIPVRLFGLFTALDWKIDFSALAKDMAKQKVDEKKEEVKTKLQDKLKEGLKGLFGNK